ncbi:hypothetical protein BH11PSE12_BH11PSE12_04770 [soil metagenome]
MLAGRQSQLRLRRLYRLWWAVCGIVAILTGILPLDVSAFPGCEKVIISADPSYPPLHWYDGTDMQGASLAVVTRIFSDLGIPYELRYLGPFNRVLAAAQSGAIDVVATLKDTPERRVYLSFSHTVLLNPVAAFVLAEKRMHFSAKSDLVAYHGGIARGNRFGEPLDTYMKTSLRIEEANDLDSSFKMLAAGRFDYVITGFYPARAYLMGLATDHKIVALSPFLTQAPNLAGFVSKSPCAAYLPAFNKQLEKLLKEKFIERAIEKASEQWRQHPVLVK